MKSFEIFGNRVTGGGSARRNEFLIQRINDLEGFAESIGKSLGMASLDSLVVTTETDGYGFRFARTSEEKFDTKGVQIAGCKQPSELVECLG